MCAPTVLPLEAGVYPRTHYTRTVGSDAQAGLGVRAKHAGNAGTRRMRRSPVRLPHGVGVQVIGYAQHAERRRPLHRASRDLGGVASPSSPPGEVSALKKKKKKQKKSVCAFSPVSSVARAAARRSPGPNVSAAPRGPTSSVEDRLNT